MKIKTSSASLCSIVVCACLPTLAAGAPERDTVTFTKDVAPILQANCQTCHRPGEVAPMSFMTYRETRPWAESIKENVLAGTMPPWHADADYGHFANDRRLTKEEITTLVAWVDGGAPRGNPADLPPPREFVEGWTIGQPDAVYPMTEAYEVEAEGKDDYVYFTIPLDFEEERFIQAIELRPGNRAVVHHALVLLQPKGSGVPKRGDAASYNERAGFQLFRADGDTLRVRSDVPVHDNGCELPSGGSALGSGAVHKGSRPLIAGFVPGAGGRVWPKGWAQRIPPGSELLLQMHYAKTGKVETDRSSVGIIFAEGRPEKTVAGQWIRNHYFQIPPGATNHEVTGCHTFTEDIRLYALSPHMHLRGKDMEFKAIYPDGRTETLLSVPSYDFNWQTTYDLETPAFIPKGTQIIVTAHFDNSRHNPFNPDPTATVRWGDPTYDEMMIGIMTYVTADEDSKEETPDPHPDSPSER